MATLRSALYGKDKLIPDDFGGLDKPKLKFNYTMRITYGTALFTKAPIGALDATTLDFGVRQFTRPNINVVYEDVNYYNFMTKVATKVDFGVITVTLYDDNKNRAHSLFQNYMEYISPLTHYQMDGSLLDRKGMEFSDDGYAATLGKLDQADKNGPILKIELRHHHNTVLKPGEDYTDYIFRNPKIQNVVLDEVDATQSDVNTISFTFLYDSYNIDSDTLPYGTYG